MLLSYPGNNRDTHDPMNDYTANARLKHRMDPSLRRDDDRKFFKEFDHE